MLTCCWKGSMEHKEGLEDKSERGGGEMIVTMEEKSEEKKEEVEEKSEIGGDIIEEKGDDDQYWLQLETPDERKYEINVKSHHFFDYYDFHH